MSSPLRSQDLNGGYKLLLENILDGMASLKDDFKDYKKDNGEAHGGLHKKIDLLQKDFNKFIQTDFKALEIKILIRGAIAGLIPTLIGLIIGGLTIWKYVSNVVSAGTP